MCGGLLHHVTTTPPIHSFTLLHCLHLPAYPPTCLQDKCEPPIYVSDRRFMKAVQLLQVAAHADGRAAVNEYDCLLLEYVFGNRPDDSHKVRAQVLEIIASDPGLQQTELVFLGLFGRWVKCEGAAADTP